MSCDSLLGASGGLPHHFKVNGVAFAKDIVNQLMLASVKLS